MSSIFEVMQSADMKEKNLVNGYIKQYIQHPPELITTICLWFYHQLIHPYSIIHSYDELNLKEDLLRGIYSYGLESPSPIERHTILPIIERNDIIIQAQFGLVRCAAYSIPALQILDPNIPQCQILKLSPTRESAQSTHKVLKSISVYLSVTTRSVIGGTAVRDDITHLIAGIQCIHATPGRILDMLTRGCFKLDTIKLFIIDEIDEMYSSGFQDQIHKIMEYLPSEREYNIVVFSATITNEILKFSGKYMVNPIKMLGEKQELSLDDVGQYYILIEKEEYKLGTLYDLYESLDISQSIIYCNTQQQVIWLTDKMKQCDCTVRAIHDDITLRERKLILREFGFGAIRVLIVTDCLKDDIEMKSSVKFIVNYDLPLNKENYIHRIGKCEQYPWQEKIKCIAINFVTDKDEERHKEIQAFYKTKIEELPMDIQSIM